MRKLAARNEVAHSAGASTPPARKRVSECVRKLNMNGYSSDEESLHSLRKASSFARGPDSCSSLKLLIGTPDASLRDKCSKLPSQEILEEIDSVTDTNGTRPPSPRPYTNKQVYIERNKQMQVWEEWVHASHVEISSARYKRTSSANTPNKLAPMMTFESDSD